MDDILNEAYGIVQCKECAWYKTCVTPMRFTAEDVRRQMEQSAPGMNIPQQMDPSMQNLLSNMASAAQNIRSMACGRSATQLWLNGMISWRLGR